MELNAERRKRRSALRFFLNLLIMPIIMMGASCVLGYATDIECFYTWSKTPMAINTGIGFLFIGTCLFVINNWYNFL